LTYSSSQPTRQAALDLVGGHQGSTRRTG